MDKPPQVQAPVFLIDNPNAPEFFASEALGFFLHGGTVHITFASPRASHTADPSPINRVVNLRVVLPIQGAQSLAMGLYDFLKTQGLDPAAKPPGLPVQ
jgi:hypothetical protein